MNRLIAIIPARGGSKGLPGKNLLTLHGYPLLAWSILFARVSNVFSRIIVTTDSSVIRDIALEYNAEVPFLRSASLSSDIASTSDVVVDVIQRCSLGVNDIIILLEPTSPYRELADFRKILSLYEDKNTQKVMSVSQAVSTSYVFQYFRSNRDGYLKALLPTDPFATVRRQDIVSTYYLDGSYYASNVQAFLDNPTFLDDSTKSIVSNPLSSFEIDCSFDFEIYQAIFAHFGAPSWYTSCDFS